jgi:hypothetical protein
MKKFLVTFKDTLEANSEEDAYDELIKYLRDVVRYEDVTTFDFKEVK